MTASENSPHANISAQLTKLLSAPFELPCGSIIPNRLVKTSSTELHADTRNRGN
jgi:hypothetical protein